MTIVAEQMHGAEEAWTSVEGHPGYEVSNQGRVRSLPRMILRRDGRHYSTGGGLLSPVSTADGYKVIQTRARKALLVHRLVALAFLDADPTRPQVNHKDGNRANNQVENLEWATNAENCQHAFDVLGRRPSHLGKFGDDHHRSKAVIATCLSTNKETRYGSARLAAIDGFVAASIAKVCLGKMKKHHGHSWRYAE